MRQDQITEKYLVLSVFRESVRSQNIMKQEVSFGRKLSFLKIGNAAQAGWLIFTLFALSLALPGITTYQQALQVACPGIGCLTGQVTLEEAQIIQTSGRTLSEYAFADFIVFLFTDTLLLITATILIWRKSAQPAAVCGAFALAAAATGTLAQTTAHMYPALMLPAQFIHFIQLSTLFPFFGLIPDDDFRPGWLRWVALALVPISALVAFNVVGDTSVSAIAISMGVLVIGSAIYRYRSPISSERQEQAIWVLAAAVLLAGAQWIAKPVQLLPIPAMSVQNLAGSFILFFPIFGMLLTVGALTCLAVAFMSDELFRVEIAINRAFVYGLLTLFVIGGYVLVVGYLSLLFQSSGSIWFSLVATGVVAALFHPIRERVQRFVNRILYGERDDPYTILARLGQRLETTIASNEVIPVIVQTIREALKVSYAAIALKHSGEDRFTVASEIGVPSKIVIDLPLIFQNEIVGRLQLGQRFETNGFSRADRRLLNDLARQAGAAIHAASQNADLQSARQRLVTAREEERRRVRRDLHDGLGASLAALNLQAGELQRLMRINPDEAERQMQELREEIRAAIADIRRLIYGLRPPALDELGLVEALRARAAQTSGLPTRDQDKQQAAVPHLLQVNVVAPEDLPPLPAAVEAATYRIAMEALTNTIQHARAERCTIRIAAGTSGLTIDISDDGIGMPLEYTFGIGLISMRERCAELGGTWSIHSEIGQGTLVSAWLPLPGEYVEE
jgi:signal transduction histidine kinase